MAGLHANFFRRFCMRHLTKIQFLAILILIYRTYVLETQLLQSKKDSKNAGPTYQVERYEVQDKKETFHTTASVDNVDDTSKINATKTNVIPSEDVYQKRIERVNEFCVNYVHERDWRKHVPRGKIWSYGGSKGINYCIVPKVGCTYWKRIFRFISQDYPESQKHNVMSPSDIDRNFVHYGPVKKINTTTMADRSFMESMSEANLFMFVRDPYSRLWSAYIDKFFLPDFWRYFPSKAMKAIRPNATEGEISCPKDLTFLEFLTHVIKTNASTNDHWTPIYRMCGPCHVQYDVIGKQETFSQDAKFILKRYGLGDLIENESLDSRVKQETSMLIEYNFPLEKEFRKNCFEKLEVAEKLWKAFQYNGYVDKLTPFPYLSLNNSVFYSNPTMALSKVLSDVLIDQRARGVTLKSQKRELMAEAYARIPQKVIDRLRHIYRHDFELFGYDMKPGFSYGHRHVNKSSRAFL